MPNKARIKVTSRAFVIVLLGLQPLAIAQSGSKGFIGLALADVPGWPGPVVTMVKPGAPADQAGVKSGDVVVAVNGDAADHAATVTRIISEMTPRQTARLSILRRNGSSVERLTISVVVGAPFGSPGTPANAGVPPTPPSPPAPSSAHSSASIPNSSGTKAATANPLSVPGYLRLTDPIEQAFTVEVPAGWRSVGGLARRSALQINPFVRSLSPDKMTYLLIGEPTLPSFTPPSAMSNAIGHPEGTLYNAGLGGLALMMHYLPGAQFSRVYGETMLQGLCPALRFSSAQDEPDLAQKVSALLPTVIPSREDGGEATFTCMHNKQPMEVHIHAVTRITRDNIMWVVLFLDGYITPKGQSSAAEETLARIATSLKFSQAWIQRQNNMSQQAAVAINQRMQDYFRQERTFIQNLNSEDQNFESVDEIVSGFSTYHDEATGNNYSLSNTNPNKWIDESTGRIISTPTNIQPAWASAYRLLPRSSN